VDIGPIDLLSLFGSAGREAMVMVADEKRPGDECRAFTKVHAKSLDEPGSWTWIDRTTGRTVPAPRGWRDLVDEIEKKAADKAKKFAQEQECPPGCICEPSGDEQELARASVLVRIKLDQNTDVEGKFKLVYTFKPGTCEADLGLQED
jgi:hypothetical protein